MIVAPAPEIKQSPTPWVTIIPPGDDILAIAVPPLIIILLLMIFGLFALVCRQRRVRLRALRHHLRHASDPHLRSREQIRGVAIGTAQAAGSVQAAGVAHAASMPPVLPYSQGLDPDFADEPPSYEEATNDSHNMTPSEHAFREAPSENYAPSWNRSSEPHSEDPYNGTSNNNNPFGATPNDNPFGVTPYDNPFSDANNDNPFGDAHTDNPFSDASSNNPFNDAPNETDPLIIFD